MSALTNRDIRELRSGAQRTEDFDLVAICDVALAGVALGHEVIAQCRPWTQAQARAEVARVLGKPLTDTCAFCGTPGLVPIEGHTVSRCQDCAEAGIGDGGFA